MWTPDEDLRKKWYKHAGLPDHGDEKKGLLARKKEIEQEIWQVSATLFEKDASEYRRLTRILRGEMKGIDERLKQIEMIDVWRLSSLPGQGDDEDPSVDWEKDDPAHSNHFWKVQAILNDLRLGDFSFWVSGHEDAPPSVDHARGTAMWLHNERRMALEENRDLSEKGWMGPASWETPDGRPRPGDYCGWAGDVTVEKAIFTDRTVVFPIWFENGSRWSLRIPLAAASEESWDGAAREAFRAEVLTMKIIEEKTNIPVPHIFQWSADHRPDSKSSTGPPGVRFPYVLMEWIEGTTARDLWFSAMDMERDMFDVNQKRRTKCLQDVALAMVQLNKFSYDLGGRIIFDENSKPSIIGSYEEKYHEADRFGETTLKTAMREPYRDPRVWLDGSWVDGPSDPQAPRDISKRKMTDLIDGFLDSHRQEPLENGWDLSNPRAIPKLFSCRLGETPWELGNPPEKPFVMAHPQFTAEHFILKEDGSLAGVLGWENIMSVPRYVGNESYPLWLRPDWSSTCWHWDEIANPHLKRDVFGNRDPRNGVTPDSLPNLRHYRSIYAEAIRMAHSLTDETGHIPPCERSSERLSTLTTRSLLYSILGYAVRSPNLRAVIGRKIFRELAPSLSEWTESEISYWNNLRMGEEWNTLTDEEKQKHLDKESSWIWPILDGPRVTPEDAEKIKAFDSATFVETALRWNDFTLPAGLQLWRLFSTLLMRSETL